jgi:AraC family transcriptional regulator
MNEPVAIRTLGHVRNEFASHASLQSVAGTGNRASALLTREGRSSSRSVPGDEHGDGEVEPGSALRLQAIVRELFAAVRSLLRDDQESAEVSVDRVAEMMDGWAGASIYPPKFDRPTSERRDLKIRGGLAPWQIQRVTAHIESHLDGPITTQDLATIAKVSTYHFTRAFRESLSETPHGYVMRRRVERAQGLMLTTNVALGRIAIDCGFADQAHFNKLFRRLAGQSPGAWRRARVIPPPGVAIHRGPIEIGVCK